MRTRFSLLVLPLLAGGCLSHPAPPPAPYHAVGSDSQWHLIIDDKHVTFIPAGQQPIREPRPQPIIGVAGDIYQTPRIDVNIVHGACVIGERSYPDTVQVRIDGTLHTGCGGDPAEAPVSVVMLANTRWNVALVNARPTPAVGDFTMTFDSRTVTLRLGCNTMSGQFSIVDQTLTIPDLMSTQMACPEPAATFERQATSVLSQPMHIAVGEGGRVILSNSAGSISLVPPV